MGFAPQQKLALIAANPLPHRILNGGTPHQLIMTNKGLMIHSRHARFRHQKLCLILFSICWFSTQLKAGWITRAPVLQDRLSNMSQSSNRFVALAGSRLSAQDVLISTNGSKWTLLPSTATETIDSLGYGNGQFVGMSRRTAWTSRDGVEWDAWPIPTEGNAPNEYPYMSRIVWGAGLYVAVERFGSPAGLWVSTTGKEWEPLPALDANPLDVAFGNGKFVVVGSKGEVGTSANGRDWTFDTSGTRRSLNQIVFGNGVFVAVGDFNTCLTSTNGIQWTRRQLTSPWPFSGRFTDLAFGNNTFVAANAFEVFTSPNGTAWTRTEFLSLVPGIYRLNYAAGGFVSWSEFEPDIFRSTDGKSWTPVHSPIDRFLEGIAYGNGIAVAVGDASARTNKSIILTSANFVDWTLRDPGTNEWLHAVAFGAGRFVAVGDYGIIRTSANGTSWSGATAPTNRPLSAIAYGGNRFVAVGVNGTVVSSTDGLSWKAHVTGSRAEFSHIAFGNGVWVASSETGELIRSANGTDWTSIAAAPPGSWLNLAFGNNLFLLVGAQGSVWSSANGTQWNEQGQLPIPSINGVYPMAFGGGIFLVAGPAGIAFSADGADWQVAEAGYDPIYSITPIPGGFAAVGGWPGAYAPEHSFLLTLDQDELSPFGISQLQLLPQGDIRFSFPTQTGKEYSVEASSDLQNWQTLSVFPGSSSRADYTNQPPIGLMQRFYRARRR